VTTASPSPKAEFARPRIAIITRATLVITRHPVVLLVDVTVTDAPAGADDQSTTISPQARTALWASLVGTTIEWYDFFLYATAASLVFNQAFFPDQTTFVGTLLSFATFAVGFLVRPIGGFVFGHVGDRIGRKKTLAVTMFLMGGATALMGLLPTTAQIGVLAPILLLLLRIVQGFALGGEWAGAVLLAVEHSPVRRRGLFGSIPQVGLALGLALGTGVFALLQIVLPDDAFLAYGWRIAFLLSIVLVIFGVVVRLRASETPAFEKVRDGNDRAAVPLKEIFQPPALRSTVLGMLSRWGEGAAFNTWGVFAIAYATGTLKLDRVPVLISVTAAALLMAVLLPVSGLLTDRYGPKRVYAIGIAAYAVAVFPVFAIFDTRSIWAYAVAMLLVFGVIHALFYGAQGTLYASLFPARIRYTGLSTVYQLSGVYASGLTPLILTALIGAAGGSPWIACSYLVVTAAISVVATLALKPTPLIEL
jgi:MFS family permease